MTIESSFRDELEKIGFQPEWYHPAALFLALTAGVPIAGKMIRKGIDALRKSKPSSLSSAPMDRRGQALYDAIRNEIRNRK